MVVVADPGEPNGAHHEYPLKDFENAFADSGFHYVATDHAPPGFSSDVWLGAQSGQEQSGQEDRNHWLQIVQRTAFSAVRFAEHAGLGKATVAAGVAAAGVAAMSKEKRHDMMRRI